MKTPEQVVFRKSKRVILRPVSKNDLPLLTKWFNDPEVSKFVATSYPMTMEEEEEWINNLAKRKPVDVVLIIVVNKTAIGTIGLHQINHISGTAVTGAAIGEKKYWGKGYGTEAKMLLLDYAFHVLNLRKICSSVLSFNCRSVRYSEKCGYHVEGRRKDQLFRNGRYWDEIFLAVFRKDWEPLWEVFRAKHNIPE